jgi:hypothetical protein
MTKSTSPQVKVLLDEVNSRAKEIKDISGSTWKTSCSYNSINLHVENDIGVLVCILAQLYLTKEKAGTLFEKLEIKPQTVKFHDFPIDDWIHDVELRIQKISLKDKKLKLANLEKRLELILTPEERRELEIKKILEELEDIK